METKWKSQVVRIVALPYAAKNRTCMHIRIGWIGWSNDSHMTNNTSRLTKCTGCGTGRRQRGGEKTVERRSGRP